VTPSEVRSQVTPSTRRGIDPVAVLAVMSRDATIFRRYWPSTTFSSIIEPTVWLVAFGFGIGALVARVRGLDYLEWVGTGVVATAVVFSSAFPAMFATFVKRRYQRTYDALLAAPVDVDEIVTAEMLWIATRTGVYGMAPLLVAVAFGLRPGPGIALVPLVCFLTGLGFAGFGVTIASLLGSIDHFSYVTSGVLTPLMLVGGTFFPIDQLPAPAAALAQLNPVYHCVELVRHAVFGFEGLGDLGHLAALLAFAAVTWRLAIWRMRIRLVD
jgi:lipooligosaccharide transport system permease protein